jgi:hypothetical protein
MVGLPCPMRYSENPEPVFQKKMKLLKLQQIYILNNSTNETVL